jgi:hypothetical protein
MEIRGEAAKFTKDRNTSRDRETEYSCSSSSAIRLLLFSARHHLLACPFLTTYHAHLHTHTVSASLSCALVIGVVQYSWCNRDLLLCVVLVCEAIQLRFDQSYRIVVVIVIVIVVVHRVTTPSTKHYGLKQRR